MPHIYSLADYDGISACPPDVAASDWLAALNTRYHARFHVTALPSGKCAIFFDDWRIRFIGTPEECLHFFHSPPTPRKKWTPPLRPTNIREAADDLLASLNLGI